MLQAAKFLNVVQNFQNGIHDGVDIFLAAEEEMMRKPDRFLIGCTFGNRALVLRAQVEGLGASPTEGRIICRIEREERAAVDGFVEEAVAGNPLQLKRRDKGRSRNVLCLLGKVL